MGGRRPVRKAIVLTLLAVALVLPFVTTVLIYGRSWESGEQIALGIFFLGFISNIAITIWGLATLFSSRLESPSKKALWAFGILITGAICASVFLLRINRATH